jgi:hypothetical protein
LTSKYDKGYIDFELIVRDKERKMARFSTVIEVIDALDQHFASCTGKNNRQAII